MPPIGTCREAVLEACARLEARTGRDVFRLVEIVVEVQAITDRYPEYTVRTQVVSAMCADAPVHYPGHTNDLARAGRGWYRRVLADSRQQGAEIERDAPVQGPSPAAAPGPGPSGQKMEALSAGRPGFGATLMRRTHQFLDRIGLGPKTLAAEAGPGRDAASRLLLVGCVAEKGPTSAPAKDLYLSPLWRKRRRYAEASGQPWFVLSAKHGLVHPDTVIEPYDVSLAGATRDESQKWAERVLPQITAAASALRQGVVEIHAGQDYTPVALLMGLAEAGLEVRRPLLGLRVGEQLQWYDRIDASACEAARPDPGANPERGPSQLNSVSRVSPQAQAVVAARLLEWGESEEVARPPEVAVFVPSNVAAEDFIQGNAFAFLLAVIFDQGIVAERAWEAPWLLKQRLGHLDPGRLRNEPDQVKAAVAQPPALHRYVNNVPNWVVAAADQVIRLYQGDTSRIWSDRPTAARLQRRFEAFAGIGPKKAAMAVEILIQRFGVEVADLSGTNLAYDVHVRRVFLRSGLAERDEQAHMLDAARRLNPTRPGALDGPAWAIGRDWCHPTGPDCRACPLAEVCPKLVGRGDAVKGA